MKISNKIKIIGLSSAIIIAFVAYYAYSEYNRKGIDISKTKAAFNLSAIDLSNQFNSNEKESTIKYQSKVLELTGIVKKVEKDVTGFSTIVLGDLTSTSSVRCSLDSLHLNDAVGLETGKTINIKGICTGFNADDMGLGSDVILNKCAVIKSNK